MKAIETKQNSNHTFVITDEEKHLVSDSAKSRIQKQIIEHVYNGVDVILVTSAQSDKENTYIQECFNSCGDKIRTIFLSSEFFSKSQSGNSNSVPDLSMVSAIVYESIHLDEHFSIIINDADQIAIQTLNELIKLALGINSSKNNVSFIFSGGPNLLSVVERVTDIRRLSLVHCSLDEITTDDIDTYINDMQTDVDNEYKLHFNKYALKRIATHASGSLYKASILLEWCRAYSLHENNYKVTVGFIDSLLKHINQSSSGDSEMLLGNYPPDNFKFDNTKITPSDTSEVKISKDRNPQEITEAPKSKVSKTVYVDEKSSKKDRSAKIYERFMNDPSEKNLVENDNNSSPAKSTSKKDSDDTDIGSKTNTAKPTNDEEYEDTYHITAVEQINEPIDIESSTNEDDDNSTLQKLIKPKQRKKHSPMLSVLLILLTLVCVYYCWIIYANTSMDISSSISAFTNNPTEQTLIDEPASEIEQSKLQDNDAQLLSRLEIQNEQTIQSLLNLANTQILDKKLSTPPSDNALNTYRMILQFNPHHDEALLGIEKIKNQYQSWAKLDIEQGKINRAKYFLNRAIDISPDDIETRRLLSSIE